MFGMRATARVGCDDWLEAYELNADFVGFQAMHPSIVTLGMKSSFIAHEWIIGSLLCQPCLTCTTDAKYHIIFVSWIFFCSLFSPFEANCICIIWVYLVIGLYLINNSMTQLIYSINFRFPGTKCGCHQSLSFRCCLISNIFYRPIVNQSTSA